MKEEPHKHVYAKKIEQKVMLRQAGETLSGYDLLNAWKCECGDITVSDIKERVKM